MDYKQLELPAIPKAKRQRKQPDPTLGHWAVSIYRQLIELTPAPKQRELLIAETERLNLTPAAWENAVQVWVLNGYAKTNIRSMLDYANEHPGGALGPTLRAKPEREPVQPLPNYELPPASIMPKLDEWLEPYRDVAAPSWEDEEVQAKHRAWLAAQDAKWGVRPNVGKGDGDEQKDEVVGQDLRRE